MFRLVIFFCCQSSSLWRRLTLIPFRIFIALSIVDSMAFSGLLVYMFILVFVGGLMIILVRVTSVSVQEQRTKMHYIYIISLIIISFFLEKSDITEVYFFSVETYVVPLSWFFSEKEFSIAVIFIFLIIGLISISVLLLKFKGFARSL